jgi:indolepyruvate ferredoxin oxidoreductase
MKRLRGTALDPFGRTEERRMERALIREYEADIARLIENGTPENLDAAVALAELPLSIRGFGPVKQANAETAAKRRAEILATFAAGPAPVRTAAE